MNIFKKILKDKEIEKIEKEKEKLVTENRHLRTELKMIKENARINEDRANEIYTIAVINGNEKIKNYAREIMIDQYQLRKE